MGEETIFFSMIIIHAIISQQTGLFQLSSTSISKFKSFNQGQTRLVIDLYNGTSFIITAKEKRDKAILVHVDIFLGSLLNEPKTTPGK